MHRRKNRRPLAPLFALSVLGVVLLIIIGFRTHTEAAVNQLPETPQQMTDELENAETTMPLSTEATNPIISKRITTAGVDTKDEEVEVLAKLVYGEAGVCSTTEQAAVVWCVLNRVDAGEGDIITVATAPNQFCGYRSSNPVFPEIEALVRDVLIRWRAEDSCIGSVGRVLPPEYMWFSGDGTHNYFRSAYKGGTQWDWSWPSPYEEG